MVRTVFVSSLVVMLGVATSARADDLPAPIRHPFGSPGIIISADRLLPLISYESVKTTQDDGASETQSHLSLGLLNNGPYSAFGTFYNLPRVGFDWVPVRNLTIGGAAWLYTQLSATDSVTPVSGPTTSTGQPKVTYWGIAPRVGYVVPLGRVVSFWPRVGVEYHDVSSSSAGSSVSPSVTQFAFSGEALFVISAWSHFGITIGPTTDVPLSGKTTSASSTGTGTTGAETATKADSAMFQLGASSGVVGFF